MISGYPAVMLVEPFVKDLAVNLRDCMDEAIHRCASEHLDGEVLATAQRG